MVNKKFWQCEVCMDIHYGKNPPEICPTCDTSDAYLEITPKIAKKMMKF